MAEALTWAGVCFGVWVATLSALTAPELWLGAGVSVGCGVLAVAGRRSLGDRWAAPSRWLRPALLLPVAVPLDAARAFWSVLRRDPGRFASVPVAGGRGTGAVAEGRRATYVLLTSATPGSVVLDVDPDTGEALVHLVGGGWPDLAHRAAR